MCCETCAYGVFDTPAWGYCGQSGDDITPTAVCDQWAPQPSQPAHIGPASEVSQ